MNSAVSNFEKAADEIVSVDPATGIEIGRVPRSTADAVKEAVKRSRLAFHTWKLTSFAQHRELISAAREAMLAELDEIAHLISANPGSHLAKRSPWRSRRCST